MLTGTAAAPSPEAAERKRWSKRRAAMIRQHLIGLLMMLELPQTLPEEAAVIEHCLRRFAVDIEGSARARVNERQLRGYAIGLAKAINQELELLSVSGNGRR